MPPGIESFMTAHRFPHVTIIADVGVVSEDSQAAIEVALLLLTSPPWSRWRHEHPGRDIPDGDIFTQPLPVGPAAKKRDQVPLDRVPQRLVDQEVRSHCTPASDHGALGRPAQHHRTRSPP